MNKFDIDDAKVLYVNKLGGHPVHGLLMKAVNDGMDRGFQFPGLFTQAPNYDSECVYVAEGNTPIAGISFSREAWWRTIVLHWSFTEPVYRQRGLNSLLYGAIEKIAIRDGYHQIKRNTNVKNIQMQAAMEAQGFSPHNISYNKLLLDKAHHGSIKDEFSL